MLTLLLYLDELELQLGIRRRGKTNMLLPEFSSATKTESTVTTPPVDLRELVGCDPPNAVKIEREMRYKAFSELHAEIARLRTLSLAATGTCQSYHVTYAEVDGDTIKRQLLFKVADFPGLGDVARVIVNDKGPHPENVDSRRLVMRDFWSSTFSRSFTWQAHDSIRHHHDHSWYYGNKGGPFLRDQNGSLEIQEGINYITLLPRLGGYCEAPDMIMERRLQVSTLTGILTTLGSATLEQITFPEAMLP